MINLSSVWFVLLGLSFQLASGLFIGIGSHRHDFLCIPSPFGSLSASYFSFSLITYIIRATFPAFVPLLSKLLSLLHHTYRYVPSEPIHISSHVCHIQNCSSLYSTLEIIESLPVHRNLYFPSPYSSLPLH